MHLWEDIKMFLTLSPAEVVLTLSLLSLEKEFFFFYFQWGMIFFKLLISGEQL